MMPYTMENPPDWLKRLPRGAVRIGIDVYNRVLDDSGDKERARKAAWAAIKAKYKKDDDKWRAKQTAAGRERPGIIHFQAARQADDTGLVWEVVLIAPGLSASWPRFYWSEEVLAAAVGVFAGVDINAYELTADFFTHLPIPDINQLENVKRFLAAKKVGWVEKTWYEPGVGIKAEIRFAKSQAWLPEMLADGIAAGKDDILGLSIDSRIKGVDILVDDMTVVWVTEIVSCSSVDVVTHPAAGGRFLRAVAALSDNINQGGKPMNWKDRLIALIAQARADLLDGKDRAALTDEEVVALAQMAMEEPQSAKRKEPGKKDPADPKHAAQGLSLEQVQEKIAEALAGYRAESEARAACARTLGTTLAASGLPEMAAARVRSQFDGKLFEPAELDAAVKAEKDYLAQLAQPKLDLPDQTRAVVGIGTIERARMAVDRMFGLTEADMKTLAAATRLDNKPLFEDLRAAQAIEGYSDVPAFSGLREMYEFFTGDPEVTGVFNRAGLPAELRASQDINSGTFTYVLGNTLARRFVRDYREVNYLEDLLISVRKPVRDFRQQEAVMVGYFPDLATVDPETGDYQEISSVTDEESTYSLAQKGNLLTFSRKTIINDDVTLILRLVGRLGRSARRTHGKYVWNFFSSNATCSDTTAWFTSGHGNYTTSALAWATAIAAYKALAKMTEKDSGERIGLLDDPSIKPVLVGPIDLMETVQQIAEDDHYYATNDLTDKTRNPLYGKIKGQTVTLLTDTNNWGLLMPPDVVDMVEMGYLNGHQDPEMFVADSPQAEQVFVADKVRYKIRHEYAGALVDFASGYGGVVA